MSGKANFFHDSVTVLCLSRSSDVNVLQVSILELGMLFSLFDQDEVEGKSLLVEHEEDSELLQPL
jgi:hypothetical protein